MLDYDCAYLPDKKVRMRYKYVMEPTKEFCSAVIKRGWRRFGKYYFYPTCNGCSECKSLRVDVENFCYTRSQKRVLKRNKETKIIIQKPTISQMHLNLYRKYHTFKSQKDGWSQKSISYSEYHENFVDGAMDFGKEVLYLVDDKLVGVDLIDILDDGISAIYFFYDPDFPKLSLGTYSLLYQIELAKLLNLKYIYLGYWVDGCKAFAYKTKFEPLEKLDGYFDVLDTPKWI
ncbi:MAG: arginyltransferase [Sulfurospirillum sp.]|nr:MAG: arginyltransferase [Sulfurospirillum sp.]